MWADRVQLVIFPRQARFFEISFINRSNSARYKSFGDVWQIVEFENNIFFLEHLIKYTNLTQKKELIKYLKVQIFQNGLFVHKSQNQLLHKIHGKIWWFKNNNWEPLIFPNLNLQKYLIFRFEATRPLFPHCITDYFDE